MFYIIAANLLKAFFSFFAKLLKKNWRSSITQMHWNGGTKQRKDGTRELYWILQCVYKCLNDRSFAQVEKELKKSIFSQGRKKGVLLVAFNNFSIVRKRLLGRGGWGVLTSININGRFLSPLGDPIYRHDWPLDKENENQRHLLSKHNMGTYAHVVDMYDK